MSLSPPNHDMVSTTKLGRNFGWMTWSGVVSIANSIVVWVFMARMRDVDEVGRFTTVMALYALFYGIVSLGLMPYVVNELGRRLAAGLESGRSVPTFIGSVSAFLLMSGVVTALVMTACGFLVSQSPSVRLSTFSLSLAMIPSGLVMVSEANAIANGRTGLVAAVTTLENLLRTIVPLMLISAGYDLFTICLSFSAVRFLALVAYLFDARTWGGRFQFCASEFRKIVQIFPTFALTIIFASINWQAALILLGLISTDSESAKFGVASRFMIPITILMASYAGVIQPAMARSFERSPGDLGSYLAKVARVPVILATIIAIGSAFFSVRVLGVLFGETYENAAATLDIMALTTIPFCLVIVAARGLITISSQRVDLIANILGVLVCLISGLILIPRYGAAGAAFAQLLSFVSMAVVEVAYLSRKISGFNIWRTASLSSVSLVLLYLLIWKH